MGIIKGIANINAHVEAQEARAGGGDFVKAKWFSLKDKESVKVVFLQELDDASPNFSEKNDLGFIATEHSNPDNFKRKALCTKDDDSGTRCWACEKHRASYRELGDDYKGGWKSRSRLYINVLVVDGTNDPYVAILSQGLSAKQITPALIEHSGALGSITDKEFKIKRQGASFNDTQYLLTALGPHEYNVEDYELYDLNSVVRDVPFEEQEAHYLSVSDNSDSAPSREPVGVGSVSDTEAW